MRGPLLPKCHLYFPHFKELRKWARPRATKRIAFGSKSSQHQISVGMKLEKITFLIQ
jgi:hypothetical protein